MSNTLVAFFSATGTTAEIASGIATYLNSDLFEIKPENAYTQQDLNWNNTSSRTTVEGKNPNLRPAMVNDMNINPYQIIYLGFPIWWYRAPNIINTFLEKYDFTNKKIILFATSGGSGFDNSLKYLKPSATKAIIKEGIVFRGAANLKDIERLIMKGNEE